MKFILIIGQPGTGKTTLGKALSGSIAYSAYVDADTLVSVNPFEPLKLDDLLFKNIFSLSNNFIQANYQTIVISGGVRDQKTLDDLTSRLPADAGLDLVWLKADDEVRRKRKEERARDSADERKHFDFLNQLYPSIQSFEINYKQKGEVITVDTSLKTPEEVFKSAKMMLGDK